MQAAMDGHEIIVEFLIGYVSMSSLPLCLSLSLCMSSLSPLCVILIPMCTIITFFVITRAGRLLGL